MDPIAINSSLGALLPFALAVFEQGHWSPRLRATFAVLVSLAVGLVMAHAEGQLVVPQGPEAALQLAGDIVSVLVASQSSYLAIKKVGVTDYIESITNLPPIPIHIQFGQTVPSVVPPADGSEPRS